MKLLILGYARHGKDTVAEILSSMLGLRCTSSSSYACEQIVFPELKEKYGYTSSDACFADRINHREEWFKLIQHHNRADPSRLTRDMLVDHSIVVGIRCRDELQASADLFDVIVWVDASKRLEKEAIVSCTVDPTLAHIVIDNNGNREDLESCVRAVFDSKNFTKQHSL